MHTEEPLVVNHDKPVEPKEVLVENQHQKNNEPVVQPSIENNKGNDKKRKGTWNSSKENKKDKKPLFKELHMASVTKIIDDWWYDSGATTHVFNNRDLFKTYKETEDGHEVMMGDNHTSKVIGSGNMEIQFTSGKKLTLMNVHVPNIRKNLVSGFKLCKSGFKDVIESDKWIMSNSHKRRFLMNNKFLHDSTSTNEIMTQIPQDISGPNLNSNNKRNMAESSSAPRRSERARKERNLDPDFIDSQAIIFLVEGDNENNIKRHSEGYALNQYHYIDKIIDKFQHLNIEEANTPYESSYKLLENNGRVCCLNRICHEQYGSLMYATHCIRPDIAYAICKLSRYTSNPSQDHWKAIGRVFGYLKRTRQLALYYDRFPAVLEGYLDASWITGSSDSKSTTGWIFTLGGGAVC
ncbi:hypothetical protein Tco_0825183 [Tanacetum coccineum]